MLHKKFEEYKKDISVIKEKLCVSLDNGLSNKEVKERREKYGFNRIENIKPRSWFSFFWLHFKEFLSMLLIIVALIAFFSYVISPEIERLAEAVIIFIIVIINASIGAHQEYRSEKTTQELKEMMKTETVVFREGRYKKINSEELVIGDIVELKAGDKVPADIRLAKVKDFEIQEAVLTGESTTVRKITKALKKDKPLAERNNMAFMNTLVTRGKGKGIVVAIGSDTRVGTIAEIAKIEKSKIPFVEEIQVAAKKISYLALVLVVISSLAFALHGEGFYQIFLLAAALIIGAIPAALPVAVTYSLTNAVKSMARKNILVKNLPLLETLGGVDVICTDKTGTLTQNRMSVEKFFIPRDISTINPKEFDPNQQMEIIRCVLLSNEAKEAEGEENYIGDPEDVGLLEFLKSKGMDIQEMKAGYKEKEFLSFSFERKMTQSLVSFDDRIVRYTKGAPEIIIERCDKILVDGKVHDLTQEWKKKIKKYVDNFSQQALRNLAFSYKNVKKNRVGKDIGGDTFLGVVGMWDPPREGVKEAVKICYEAGIEVKMITGDSTKTAVAIAKECGFRNINAVSWDKIKNASSKELEKIVQKSNVFARMDPELKMALVKALHNIGKKVAVTGDGVNDVLSIEAAEVGIAMGKRGSEITRDAADLILLDNHFASIIEGIKYGRTTLSNVKKVTNYLTTANLFEVVLLFISSFFGFIPLQAIQILWVNFATDIFPAVSLGGDPPHKEIMKKKPTGKNEKILTKRIWYLLIGIGLKKVVLVLIVFFLVLFFSQGNDLILGIKGDLLLAQTTVFVWLGLSHVVRIVAIRWDEGWKWKKIFINKWVNYSLLWPLIAKLVIIYTFLAFSFKVKPLPFWVWVLIIITLGIAIMLAVAIANLVHYIIGEYGEKEY